MPEITTQLLICVDNRDYPASLETRKIYVQLPDATAAARGMVRVIDESGEDYLYPAARFVPAELSLVVAEAVLRAA